SVQHCVGADADAAFRADVEDCARVDRRLARDGDGGAGPAFLENERGFDVGLGMDDDRRRERRHRIWAGLPRTTACVGMSRPTTAPGSITAPRPILTPLRTSAPTPIHTS